MYFIRVKVEVDLPTLMGRYRFEVKGMCCSRCVDAVRHALSRVDGVNDIEVNRETETLAVTTNATTKERVQRAIQEIGFESVQ